MYIFVLSFNFYVEQTEKKTTTQEWQQQQPQKQRIAEWMREWREHQRFMRDPDRIAHFWIAVNVLILRYRIWIRLFAHCHSAACAGGPPTTVYCIASSSVYVYVHFANIWSVHG